MSKIVILMALMAVKAFGQSLRRLRKSYIPTKGMQGPTEDFANFLQSTEDLNAILGDEDNLWGRLLSHTGSMSMSMSMSLSMDVGSCVPDDVPEFVVDDDVDIGDTLTRGEAFLRRCGDDCYTVKDNGDDPPYDIQEEDTLRFAYKQVSSNNFSIRSRVCGVDCDQPDGDFGRTGLMVRESLDSLAKNIYASHSPNAQAEWSWRTETEGSTSFDFTGSPDVTCLWITLERDGDHFTFSYAYEGRDECDLDGELLESETQTVTIDMPEVVLVGLAVSSSGPSPENCESTEADFRDIECRGC